MIAARSSAAARVRAALESGRRRIHVAGGERAHVRRGQGYEFAELRAYVSGDDPRRIDWAASARAGMLQTRIMIEDSALVIAALIDGSPSMSVGRDESLADRARAAAAVWYGMCRSGDRALSVGSADVFEPRGTRGAAAGLACATLGPTAAPAADFDAALALAAATLPRGAALLAVGDMHARVSAETLAALGGRCDCTFLLAADPWRNELPLRGFVRLRDVESDAVRRLYFDRGAARRYGDAVARQEDELRGRFARAAWRFGLLVSDPQAALLEAFGLG